MKLTPEQAEFTIWLATPTRLRDPKTLQGYARSIGVHPSTLTRWKDMREVQDEVDRFLRKFVTEQFADLYDAAILHAKKGNHNYFKMLWEIAKNQMGVQKIEIATTDAVTKSMSESEIADKMFEILQKGGMKEVPKEIFVNALMPGNNQAQA